jgi:hypothetical protein
MPDTDAPSDPARLRRLALSRWDNEGGALASPTPTPGNPHDQLRDLTNAELIQLRIRVIALENMMIAVLAEGPDRQLEVARAMASYIAPREGFTPHPLTIQAADHMTDFVARAIHFRTLSGAAAAGGTD